jgi:HAMP domain-containing protein
MVPRVEKIEAAVGSSLRGIGLALRRFAEHFFFFVVFAVFPVAVFITSERILADRFEHHRMEAAALRHEDALGKLLLEDHDARFVADRLRKLFRVLPVLSPARRLERIQALQKRLNNCFDLYLFDERGKVVSELSSSRHGRGITERCFSILLDHQRHRRSLVPKLNPKKIRVASVEPARYGLLKGFLRVDFAENVANSGSGDPIPLGSRQADGFFLFYPETSPRKIRGFRGYMAFLQPGRIPPGIALRAHGRLLNQRYEDFQVGFLRQTTGGIEFFPRSLEQKWNFRGSFLTALSSYNPHFHGPDFHGTILARRQHGHVIAIGSRPALFPAWVRWIFYGICLFWQAWAAWAIGSGRILLDGGIRAKVILLFLFAVGFPTLLLLIGGYVALDDRIRVLQENLVDTMKGKLKQFDERFPLEVSAIEQRLRNAGRQAQTLAGNPRQLQVFQRFATMGGLNNIFVIDCRNQMAFLLFDDPKMREKERMARILAGEMLKRINGSDKVDAGTFVASAFEDIFKTLIGSDATVNDFIRTLGKIKDFSSDKDATYIYNDAIYNKKGEAEFLVLAFFSRGNVERAFFEKYYSQLMNQSELNWRVGLSPRRTFLSEFQPHFPDRAMAQKIGRIVSDQNVPTRLIERRKRDARLWLGQFGQNMKMYVFTANTSLAPLEASIRGYWTVLGWLAAFLVLITGFIGLVLSRQLLTPIGDLSGGLRAIQNRNFRHVIPIHSSDELGEMSRLLNQVMEGLDDLAVARIIQEQLFPEGELRAGGYVVFGKSRTMVDVGGDYYDYFLHGDDVVFGLLGDVSGHGVSAAMIMGMAKCFFTLENTREKPLDQLLVGFHQYLLKTVKKVKMMTMIVFRLSLRQHTLELANAGQTFPCHWKAREKKAGTIEVPAMPLGACRKVAYKTRQFAIEPGDAWFFYSDGLSEATNIQGDMVGYERVEQWFAEAADGEPQVVVDRLFERIDTFTAGLPAADDLTMICLARLPHDEQKTVVPV